LVGELLDALLVGVGLRGFELLEALLGLLSELGCAEVGVVESDLLGKLALELLVGVCLCDAVDVFAGEGLGADEEAEDERYEYERGGYGGFACGALCERGECVFELGGVNVYFELVVRHCFSVNACLI
jgi:hypothetical protein